jgi:lactoylglutathione lyase
MSESKENIVRVSAEEARHMTGETDYARLDAMTDADIAKAVAADPDAAPIDADWDDAALVVPANRQDAFLRVDDDVLSWFRGFGENFRSRMNAVLWAHMDAHRHATARTETPPRINHIALKVTDLEAATRFYENVYGFRQIKTGRSRGHISRHMTDGYIDLALMLYDSEDDAEAKLVGAGPAIHHFGIEVDDREAFVAKIEANGGTILSNEPGDNVKYRAPDGTISEIVEAGRYKVKG